MCGIQKNVIHICLVFLHRNKNKRVIISIFYSPLKAHFSKEEIVLAYFYQIGRPRQSTVENLITSKECSPTFSKTC